MEEMDKWINQGLRGFDDLTAMFRKFYGLHDIPNKGPDYAKAWEEATQNFLDSFNDYLSLMGVVPKAEYLELLGKFEDLEQKVAEQEKTIEHLRTLLDKEWTDQGEMIEGFQNVIKNQTEQFQKLMKSFGQFPEKK